MSVRRCRQISVPGGFVDARYSSRRSRSIGILRCVVYRLADHWLEEREGSPRTQSTRSPGPLNRPNQLPSAGGPPITTEPCLVSHTLLAASCLRLCSFPLLSERSCSRTCAQIQAKPQHHTHNISHLSARTEWSGPVASCTQSVTLDIGDQRRRASPPRPRITRYGGPLQ
jgi:hypothetical protein